MNPAHAALLRAIAAKVTHAQAHPTDSAGIGRLRTAQAQAEVAWVQAGTPDLPGGADRPTVMPANVGKGDDQEKDWTLVPMDVEVLRCTERAVLLDGGDGPFWCPRSVLRGPEDLRQGNVIGVSVPRWVTP